MADPVPEMHVALTWDSGLEFTGQAGKHEIGMDGSQYAGPSPMQLLALSLAGCMAVDIVHIIQRCRHALTGLEGRFIGERSPEDPKRFTRIRLHFVVNTDAPPDKVQHALDLSREKYCSVWNSMRQDLPLELTFAIDAEA